MTSGRLDMEEMEVLVGRMEVSRMISFGLLCTAVEMRLKCTAIMYTAIETRVVFTLLSIP